jgi:hypothetical protein
MQMCELLQSPTGFTALAHLPSRNDVVPAEHHPPNMHQRGALRNSVRVRRSTKKSEQIKGQASKLLKGKKATALHLSPLQSTDIDPTLTTANLPLKSPTPKRKPVGIRRVRFGVTTVCQPTSALEGSSSKDLNMCEQFLAFVPNHRSHQGTDRPSQSQDINLAPSPCQAKAVPSRRSYRGLDSCIPSEPGDASLSVRFDRLDQVQIPPASRTRNFTFRITVQQAPPERLTNTSSNSGVVHWATA